MPHFFELLGEGNTTNTILILISVLVSSIIGPIIVHFVKEFFNKKGNKDLVKESLEVNALVENKIESIKERYNADRVWIEQFHNGGYFYPTGKSIQKFSMFYEVVSSDTPSIIMQFQNIPVSLFNKSINHLSENEIISIPDFNNEEVDTYGLKYLAEGTNCKSTYIFALRSIEGRFIAMLGIDYTGEAKGLSEKEISNLHAETATISSVLMSLLNKK